jgi:hypothetical protein
MNVEDKLEFLQGELDDRIRDFARKRNRDKSIAFRLKILGVLFAASITVLLGLEVSDVASGILSNFALALGAIITVLNAVEAFYDHRSLWIRRTVTLARFYQLRRDLGLYAFGSEPEEIDVDHLGKLMHQYNRILEDDLKAWLGTREAGSSESLAIRPATD